MLEVLVPELEPGEVLIELNTAGVGGWDADMREGWWPNGHPKLPLILGTDGSGIRIGYTVSFRYCRIPTTTRWKGWSARRGTSVSITVTQIGRGTCSQILR